MGQWSGMSLSLQTEALGPYLCHDIGPQSRFRIRPRQMAISNSDPTYKVMDGEKKDALRGGRGHNKIERWLVQQYRCSTPLPWGFLVELSETD